MEKNLIEMEQQILAAMGDGAAESQSVVPVLRPEHKTATARDLGWIWAGAQLTLSTWAVGALTTIVFGLDLAGAIGAIILGCVLGGIMVGMASLTGKHGAPQMLLARYSLGMKGANLTSFFNFVANIGWFAANTLVATLACYQILGLMGLNVTALVKVLALLVIVGLQAWFGLTNFKLMKKIEMILVIPTGVLMLVMSSIAMKDVDWTIAPSGPAAGSSLHYWGMFISAAGAVGIGLWGAWSPYAADFSRYFQFKGKKEERQAFWVPMITGTVLGIWLESMGAVFAAKFHGADPALHIAKSLPGFALPALVIVLGGLLSANVLNLVNGGLSAKVIWKWGTRGFWTTLIAVIGLFMTAYSVFVSDIASVFHTFLISLLIWEAPWFAVTMVDYFLVREQDYRIADLYRLNRAIPDYNNAGMIAYVAGFVAAFLTSFTGVHDLFGFPLYSPIMLKYFNGTDVSFFVGALVSGGIYFAATRRREVAAEAVAVGD